MYSTFEKGLRQATMQFGGAVTKRRLHLRRWDTLLTKTFPQLLQKDKFISNRIKNIIITSQKLNTFHVGSFQSLQTLDLSNNMIESVKYCGLENCVNLWALNLENNRLSDEDDIPIFGLIPSLRALFLSRNPFHDARLTSDFRFKVIYHCRNLRGSDTHSGLLYLDGHQSSLEEKVDAMMHMTGNVSLEEEKVEINRGFLCCGTKIKNKLINKRLSHIEVRPSDRYKLRLLLQEKYGMRALQAPNAYEKIQHLCLPRKGIMAIDLNLFGGQLVSLDLSNNFLNSIVGLENQLKMSKY